MSNPAVIILDAVNDKSGRFQRFQMEDNIGEAIHLHIDQLRFDFSVNEFLDFSQLVRRSLKEMDLLCGYGIDNFDEHFLKQCSPYLPDLKAIRIEEAHLSDLRCIVHASFRDQLKPTMIRIKKIKETPAYKFLNGDKSDFLEYDQYNYFSKSNEMRLLQNLESIKNSGYPYRDQYIVVFDGQNLIRDGQHRAAILAHVYGLDAKIKIMKFYFKRRKHLVHPVRNNAKNLLKWFSVHAYRKLKFKRVFF